MLEKRIILALNGVDDVFLEETALKLGCIVEENERIVAMNKNYKHSSRRFLSILIAACMLLSLGIAAYASDYFGLRALLIKEENYPPTPYEDGAYISITQPQEVPEEMSADVKGKIENSTKAWAEWDSWRRENGIIQPEVFIAPEGCDIADYIENEDGTYTIIFYDAVITEDDKGNVIDVKHEEMERRTATAEEYKQDMAFAETMAKGFDGYDFNYHVESQKMADKLEEIAAKYGLQLRHTANRLYQNFGEQTEFLSREELTEKVNEICAGGAQFFRTEPTGYDKFYYFDEGTFAVSFYTTEDMTNKGTYCYLYNSPYGTLSSGFEIVGLVKDVNAMSSYTHTTPDGTELTVLHNGMEMYAYVYLENSFVTLSFHQVNGLSTEEINSIIDMIDFSTIS
ncbi:MAG: hypothetical protein IJ364_03195 [Oscillospiraceae bacterium]|nr:hypothetical protein [Oscillospiraceae bacterium]